MGVDALDRNDDFNIAKVNPETLQAVADEYHDKKRADGLGFPVSTPKSLTGGLALPKFPLLAYMLHASRYIASCYNATCYTRHASWPCQRLPLTHREYNSLRGRPCKVGQPSCPLCIQSQAALTLSVSFPLPNLLFGTAQPQQTRVPALYAWGDTITISGPATVPQPSTAEKLNPTETKTVSYARTVSVLPGAQAPTSPSPHLLWMRETGPWSSKLPSSAEAMMPSLSSQCLDNRPAAPQPLGTLPCPLPRHPVQF